ncbi:hypothetical protein B0A55_05705 [Friedmanniomyces simplex]|uniref:Uncharacterized protein n=1 Tax=Friedmanniomyces simplex TaxID=329884 RepID=A0A4U0XIS7_9PEZI|nr:hypothetical protein B0A55_05705 [Friedmanniomyces simplex]
MASSGYNRFQVSFRSIAPELRNMLYESTFNALLADLQRRADGTYGPDDIKPNLQLIEDAQATLQDLTPDPGEPLGVWTTFFETRVRELRFHFTSVEDFLQYHQSFTRAYPHAWAKISVRPAEIEDGKTAHSRCFGCPERVGDSTLLRPSVVTGRGCAYCELRACYDQGRVVKLTDRMLATRRNRVGHGGGRPPGRRSSPRAVTSWRKGVGIHAGTMFKGGPLVCLSVEGELGRVAWGRYGKVGVFGGWVDVEVMRPGIGENMRVGSGRLKRVVGHW